METFRPHRSPGTERFLGLFADAPPPITSTSVELNEDDVFWTGTDPSDDSHSPIPASPMAIPNPSPGHHIPKSRLGRLSNRNFGILAALHEEDGRAAAPFVQRKPSFSSLSLASSTPSPPSAARIIPSNPKLKAAEYSISVPARKVFHQSAPVNVPLAPPRQRKGRGEAEFDRGGAVEDGDEEEMLPPHEIVARASAKDSPMTTFSVLEGVGRTLKGRDLRRVRNAVWRQTGFLD